MKQGNKIVQHLQNNPDMGPWKKRHNDALEEVARLEKLLEAAKAAHKAQEEGGIWEPFYRQLLHSTHHHKQGS